MRFLAALVLILFLPGIGLAEVPGFMKARMGALSGQVVIEGHEPPEDGYVVSFFDVSKGPPPGLDFLRRIPDMVGRTDKTGKFAVNLLPGKYYMGTMQGKRGSTRTSKTG